MTIRHIEIFAMVCRESSVTRAAEKLHISQPTVSVAIKEMENHYGEALFERISHRLYLTPFGRRIYDYALSLLSLHADMTMAQPNYDLVRVGAGTAIGKLIMPRVVKSFSDLYPDIHVEVTVGDAIRVYSRVMQNTVDFVIAETVEDIYGLGHRVLQSFPIVAVCRRDNPIAGKRELCCRDLEGQNLLLREPGSITRTLVDMYFYNNGMEVSPTWESYSVQTLLNATMENLGISFQSLDHVIAFSNPELVILNVTDFSGERQVNLCYQKSKIFTPSMQLFIDFYLEESGKMLSEGIDSYRGSHPGAELPRVVRDMCAAPA